MTGHLPARRLLFPAISLLLLLVPAAASVGASDTHALPHQRSAQILGIDGLYYDYSPSVVLGLQAEKFYGPDFDLACGYGGNIKAGMKNLSKLARMIQKSGRTTIFTVAPNKSSVLTSRIDPSQLPHGSCDQVGIGQQTKLLDSYSDPRYLPVRHLLHKEKRQTYWKTDLHWTSVGASVFTKALATRLSPKLGKVQRYRKGSLTQFGGLNALLHIPDEETAETATVRGGEEVTPRKVAAAQIFDNSWQTNRHRQTWPGRTLVIGDSMMSAALYNLRPIFARGRFMWLGHVTTADLAKAIAKADTVIFETIQIFVPVVDIGTAEFRGQVKHALRGS
jgi:hypothetical protein